VRATGEILAGQRTSPRDDGREGWGWVVADGVREGALVIGAEGVGLPERALVKLLLRATSAWEK